jgi:hypothetical protein
VTIEEIAQDPRYLLHRVDPVRRQLHFRPTAAEAVRDAAFIDGRTEIWTGPAEVVSFDDAGQLAAEPAEPTRAIFHMSFCGSTLLARLLDSPAKVLALKEPNCLVDLADWKKGAGADFEPILRFAMTMLGRPWAAGEEVLLKPSSWANNLIDDLIEGGQARAVFVTIERDRFLEAVLRGGSERMAFAARLAAHLAPFVDGGPARLQAAIDAEAEPIGKVARLALAAHDFELRLFERAGVTEVIDFAMIEESPFEAASTASDALQLGLDESEIEANCERWAGANAKAEATYSVDQRASENTEVRAAYGTLIDDALAWAEDALGPAELQRA